MDDKVDKTEVSILFEEAKTQRQVLHVDIKSQNEYINQQNKLQDESLEKRFAERDKINAMILNELIYIKKRVDRIPTK